MTTSDPVSATSDASEFPPDAPGEPGLWDRFRARRRGRGRQDAIFLGVAAIWVVFDQVTKVIVRETLAEGDHERLAPFFRFSHIENHGGAFGAFGDANAILAVSAVVAIIVLGVYYLFPVVDHWIARLGLALILGGAIGNLLDRIYQGSVTDFVNFNEFPAFNVADAGINIGVVLILLTLVVRDATRPGKRTRRELASLVESVCDEMAETGAAIEVEDAQKVVVFGDPVALRRLVTNLAENAIKFGGSARARVFTEDRSAIVEIADEGPGIPEAEIERVFEPFYRREPSRSRETGGIGLGLAVVRSIARAHGGDVVMANRLGGGLTARVILPI